MIILQILGIWAAVIIGLYILSMLFNVYGE